MATLNLLNQENAKNSIAPKIQNLKDALDLRKSAWQKIPKEKREKWVNSNKDPIITLAFSIYKYLNNNFFGEKFYESD